MLIKYLYFLETTVFAFSFKKIINSLRFNCILTFVDMRLHFIAQIQLKKHKLKCGIFNEGCH